MNTNTVSNLTDYALSIGLGILGALFVAAILRGQRIGPLDFTYRGASFVLAALGFVMCTLALSQRTGEASWSWTNPLTIVAVTLGALAVVLILLMSAKVQPPFIGSERGAFILLAAIIAAKVVVGHLRIWLV